MSSNKTLYVKYEDLLDAGFGQFKEGSGKHHPLVKNGDYLEYNGGTTSGRYRDDDKISAYDLVNHLEFAPMDKNTSGSEALMNEGRLQIKDEIELNGEIFELRVN